MVKELRTVDTVGMEIEFDLIPQREGSFVNKANNLGWGVEHDASCETPGALLPAGISIKKSKLRFPISKLVLGGELVSKVLINDSAANLNLIKKTTKLLYDYGENGISTRSSIHFHLYYGHVDIYRLKSIIYLAGYLEKLFFVLGGMGYTNRCIYNQAAYARPITKMGPIVSTNSDGYYVPAMVFEDLLDAKNKEEFFHRYGDSLNMARKGVRYAPIRYHWINLYNLLRGSRTLEFRIFNYTLNPMYIWAVLQLCVKFTEYTMNNTVNDMGKAGITGVNSAFDTQSKDEIALTLANFLVASNTEDLRVVKLLETILKTSPLITIPENYVRCHLNNPASIFNDPDEYSPPIIKNKDIKRANNIDIHNIEGVFI